MAGKKNKSKKAADGGALITPPGSAEKVARINPDGMEVDEQDTKVYLPGMELAEGEELEVDPSAYVMLHEMNAEWPCLSFDIVRDGGEEERTSFPMSGYLITGSQADARNKNLLYLLRCTNLHKTLQKGEEEEDEDAEDSENSEDSEEEDDKDEGRCANSRKDPRHYCITVPHEGGVNRVRSSNVVNSGALERVLTATWADTGRVHIWDLQPAFSELASIAPENPPSLTKKPLKPLHTVTQHKSEGFALSWSQLAPGRLLAGDCKGDISLTEVLADRVQGGEFFKSHQGSVEDLQWSPSEATVFASASVDGTVRLWDTRMPRSQAALATRISPVDINVISWNQLSSHMLASGADDGTFATWDLRTWPASTKEATVGGSPAPLYSSNWHRDAITSLEWSPHDVSVLAVSGADDQLTIWDFALEQDNTHEVIDDRALPANLLFVHQGQKEIKELHWHPQLSGVIVSTALSGFNIFKTISV